MKRLYCYPSFSVFIPLFGAFMSFVCSCFFFEMEIVISEKIAGFAFFNILTILWLLIALWHIQWIRFKSGLILLRNPFGVLEKIDATTAIVTIQSLKTYANHTKVFHLWICIYADSTIPPFSEGCTNSRKKGRIQLLYSRKAMDMVTSYRSVNKRDYRSTSN